MGKSKVICPICNKEFERATAKKKYCGTECQRLANIKHTREKQKMRHPGKIGRPVKKREKAVKKMRRHESELVKVAREAKQAGMTYGKYALDVERKHIFQEMWQTDFISDGRLAVRDTATTMEYMEQQ